MVRKISRIFLSLAYLGLYLNIFSCELGVPTGQQLGTGIGNGDLLWYVDPAEEFQFLYDPNSTSYVADRNGNHAVLSPIGLINSGLFLNLDKPSALVEGPEKIQSIYLRQKLDSLKPAFEFNSSFKYFVSPLSQAGNSYAIFFLEEISSGMHMYGAVIFEDRVLVYLHSLTNQEWNPYIYFYESFSLLDPHSRDEIY